MCIFEGHSVILSYVCASGWWSASVLHIRMYQSVFSGDASRFVVRLPSSARPQNALSQLVMWHKRLHIWLEGVVVHLLSCYVTHALTGEHRVYAAPLHWRVSLMIETPGVDSRWSEGGSRIEVSLLVEPAARAQTASSKQAGRGQGVFHPCTLSGSKRSAILFSGSRSYLAISEIVGSKHT